jgi:hypothetical protein
MSNSGGIQRSLLAGRAAFPDCGSEPGRLVRVRSVGFFPVSRSGRESITASLKIPQESEVRLGETAITDTSPTQSEMGEGPKHCALVWSARTTFSGFLTQ